MAAQHPVRIPEAVILTSFPNSNFFHCSISETDSFPERMLNSTPSADEATVFPNNLLRLSAANSFYLTKEGCGTFQPDKEDRR
jgi:hypothetical protein